jgi:hypothetical protein
VQRQQLVQLGLQQRALLQQQIQQQQRLLQLDLP